MPKVLPVLLYLFSKKDLQQEGRSAWSLRRWSRPVAAVGAVYCIAVVTVQIFPSKNPITINSISWTPVVVVGTLLISLITWKLYGSRHYSGPIRALTKWETGVELDLDSTLQMSTQRDHAPSSGGRGSDSSLKLAVTPCYPEVRSAGTVTINSARTASIVSGGEWAAAPFTTTGGGDDIARDLGMSFSSASVSGSGGATTGSASGTSRSSGPTVSFALGTSMGRVPEVVGEEDGDGLGAGPGAARESRPLGESRADRHTSSNP